MRVIEIPAGGEPSLRLLGDRAAAILSGGKLRLLELGDAGVVREQVIDGVRGIAAAGDSVVALLAAGNLTRWVRDAAGWREGGHCEVAARERARVAASASGRFVVVDGNAAQLADLETGRVLANLTSTVHSVRPCFDRFPDGREVLFAAVPDYLGVTVFELPSGNTVVSRAAGSNREFCHTNFRLGDKGGLLVTFGCVWAAPYEARIYDARAWTRGLVSGTKAPPSPTIRTIEALASNTLLATDVGPEGELTSACLELQSDLAPDEDGDLPSGLEELQTKEPEIASKIARLSGGEAEAVLIVRVLDPKSAATIGAGVWPVSSVPEQHLHYVDGHRVVVAGPRLLVADPVGGALADHGELRMAKGDASAVTRDGELLVIARPAD